MKLSQIKVIHYTHLYQTLRLQLSQGVYNILSNCNPYKLPGPDCIHPYALKATTNEVSPMLTHIFQQSLDSDAVPTQWKDWKHAYVLLVFKKSSKIDPKNYHPISLMSDAVNQTMKRLDKYNILTDS